MAQIGHHLTFHPRSNFPNPDIAPPDSIRESFVLTKETGGICSCILQRLALFPKPQPGAFLFTGQSGSGKTHVLRYLASLLDNPQDSAWDALSAYLEGAARPENPRRSRFIRIPSNPGIDLGQYLLAVLESTTPPDSGERQPAAQSAPLLQIAPRLASAAVSLVILEDISRRIDQTPDDRKLQEEMCLYRSLSEALSLAGVLLVLVGEERHLKQERTEAENNSPFAALGHSCELIRISRGNIAEVLASAIVTKGAGQKAAILNILERLKQKLPSFEPDPEEFVDIYPLHPAVFQALFQVRMVLRGFSPLRFAHDAAAGAVKGSEDELVLLDDLFDYIQPELARQGRFGPLLSSYEGFRTNIVPRFKASVRPRVEAVLKALVITTLCEPRRADIKSLANSLLLFEESEFLPSYSITAALLAEMEQKGGMHLVAEGERLERSYRLLDLANTPGTAASPEQLEREAEFRRRLPLLVCDWIHAEIHAWRPDYDANSEHCSTSIIAPIPEGDLKSSGLVYFKSIYEPYWTPEDILSLEASRFPWILLVLSPLERLYGTDFMPREIATLSDRILIWLPDKPSRQEVEHLQQFDFLDLASAADPVSDALADEAHDHSHQILKTLYVKRGHFISAAGEWPLIEEIGDRTLASYLSIHLLLLASTPGEPAPEGMGNQRAAGRTDERGAIRIAALLSNLGENEARDPDFVRKHLQEWWNSMLEMESHSFPGRKRPLSDSVNTTHLWQAVRSAGNHLQNLKPVLQSFCRGETSLRVAMDQVMRHFSGDAGRLAAWRDSMQNLAGLMRWLPGFETARDYLLQAFPLGHEELDKLRASLIGSAYEAHRFLQPSERDEFDRSFLEFKKEYTDSYHARHEEVLNIIGSSPEDRRRVDGKALLNLELLSTLLYADKSHLNRVRILTQWILHNQCQLPVREILERYPRCYCNFNPSGYRELADTSAQINALIDEGVEHYRDALRKCSRLVIAELTALKIDDQISSQVAALLSRGPLVSIKPGTIEVLNRIIAKHPTDFVTSLRP